MKRALAILVGVVIVCAVAYVSWLNPTGVEFRVAPTRSVQAPLAALMIFACIIGVLLVLSVVMIQAGRRAFLTWWQGREQRRVERIEEWEERGEALVWHGEIQQGRALLHKAWQRRPEGAHAVLALAASYQDTGELERARTLLAEAAQQHHTNPDVLFALAEAHRAAGEHAACIDVFERLRALQPRAPRALRGLRDGYVEAKRWSDAAAVQEALLAELRDPECAAREREHLTALRYQAGTVLHEAAARAQAFEALADSRGGSLPMLVSLGDALSADGRGDEASVVWERALRGTPRTVLVERLAGIATEARHRERLATVLRKLRGDQVQMDNVHLLAAELYLADGNVDDAARELDAIEDAQNAPPLLQGLRAEVHRRRGHLEQALDAYRRGAGKRRMYHCTVCQRAAPEWTGYCTACGGWDTYRSDIEIGIRS
ncbi:MAG: tetratricopeptide repeat protein [Candidatus Binatia bacterium]